MQKQTFNYHTHTFRCGHADGLDIQYIESAIAAGFKTLGFSDHIPYKEVKLKNCRMLYSQNAEYIATMKQLQEAYRDQIEIRYGYEVEYTRDHYEYLRTQKKQCEYMILGQHCKYIGYEYDCYCSDDDVLMYAAQIAEALSKNFITYVAHPDYFMLGRRTYSSACETATKRIAEASLAYDTPLEINLNGFQYGKKTYEIDSSPNGLQLRYPYPYRDFWEIIATYGCKVVYGYDAHSPIAFQEKNRILSANAILKDLPLNFIQSVDIK